jgi:aspartate aminotransferase
VPSWNNNHYTQFVGGKHCVIETRAENDFMPSAADIAPHLQGAVLLCLCSPQNPTGTTISGEDLASICDSVLQENARRGPDEKKLYVMYDQMYWHLTYGGFRHYNPVSARPAMRDYTIYIDAISKVFAATGVRVGWAFGPSAVIQKMKALLTHIGAWSPMAEQKATAAFLLQTEAIDRYLGHFKKELEKRLSLIHDGFMHLKQEGFNVDSIAPQASIYLTVKIDLAGKRTADGKILGDQGQVTSYLLDEAKIALIPFSAFGARKDSPWYRLSVGTCQKDQIDIMLDHLRIAMQKLS